MWECAFFWKWIFSAVSCNFALGVKNHEASLFSDESERHFPKKKSVALKSPNKDNSSSLSAAFPGVLAPKLFVRVIVALSFRGVCVWVARALK